MSTSICLVPKSKKITNTVGGKRVAVPVSPAVAAADGRKSTGYERRFKRLKRADIPPGGFSHTNPGIYIISIAERLDLVFAEVYGQDYGMFQFVQSYFDTSSRMSRMAFKDKDRLKNATGIFYYARRRFSLFAEVCLDGYYLVRESDTPSNRHSREHFVDQFAKVNRLELLLFFLSWLLK